MKRWSRFASRRLRIITVSRSAWTTCDGIAGGTGRGTLGWDRNRRLKQRVRTCGFDPATRRCRRYKCDVTGCPADRQRRHLLEQIAEPQQRVSSFTSRLRHYYPRPARYCRPPHRFALATEPGSIAETVHKSGADTAEWPLSRHRDSRLIRRSPSGSRLRYHSGQKVTHGLLEQVGLLVLWRMPGLFEHHQFGVRDQRGDRFR